MDSAETLTIAGPSPARVHVEPTSSSTAGNFRTLGLAMVGGGAALTLLPDLGPLCALRRLTGVPCPLCGVTTGVLALSRGDLLASIMANPAALVLVLAVVVSFLPFVYRSVAFTATRQRVGPTARWAPWGLVPLLWIWQLHRYDFI